MLDKTLKVRVSSEQRERWRTAAVRKGFADLSDYIRDCVERDIVASREAMTEQTTSSLPPAFRRNP